MVLSSILSTTIDDSFAFRSFCFFCAVVIKMSLSPAHFPATRGLTHQAQLFCICDFELNPLSLFHVWSLVRHYNVLRGSVGHNMK